MSKKPSYEKLETGINSLALSKYEGRLTRETVIDSEERYRLFLEAIPDSVIVYDTKHMISYINDAFTETYGWSKNDLIGGMIEFVPSEEIENTKEAWRRTLGGERVLFDTKRNTKDGRVLNIQLRTAILKDQGGNHTTSIVIHRDVTALKHAEIERERLTDRLKKALTEVNNLSGLLPICSHCKKIRDDKECWNSIESYIEDNSETKLSHSICPECADKYYPDMDIYDE